MQRTKRFLVLGIALLTMLPASAQRSNMWSRSELGVLLGGMYYIGDLNQNKHFKHTNLSGGLIFRYNVHARLAWRANFIYGSVEGYDSEAKRDVLVNRNLSFQSEIFELGTGVEFNYFPFEMGHDRYKGTAYMFAELALFRMNPKTEYNDELVELQPLGTEGQGTSLSNKNNYSLTQLAIPIGVGFKCSLGKNASFGMEYGIRFLFTDYLDDVGSYRYVNPAELASENGPLAAELSNRSLDGSRFGRRGNTATRDWYAFAGATLTFRLGRPSTCWH